MEAPDPKPQPEVCIIKIVFPIASDEEAIKVKQKIAAILAEIPETVINFSLMSGRPPVPG